MATDPRFAVLVLASLALAGAALGQPQPMKPQFQVSQATLYGQYSYGLAIDDANRFVVTWSSYDDEVGYQGLARLYDAEGNAEGGEFAVDPSSTNAQYEGTVAKNA